MMKNYVVYKHTTPNNKVYIGITCQKPIRRWAYGYGYKGNPYFYKAIKKYGWNNIKHEILLENLSKEKAIEKEIQLIKKYDSTNREKGYNITKGGEGVLGVVFTEERKKKISEAKMGHKVTEETRQKIREKNSGENHWNFGKKMKNETKEKISKSHKGMVFTEEHKKNLSLGHKGQKAWNKGLKISEEEKNKQRYSHKHLSVVCVETNEQFYSIREANRKTNINVSHIAEVCKGIRKTAGGYHWEYVGGVV